MRTLTKQDLEELSIKFKPYMDKLTIALKKKNIKILYNNDNMYFEDGTGKSLAISYGCMYRESGLCKVHKEKGESGIELVEVTDEMWIDSYMRVCVEIAFKDK
jgi:hypothetical protein